MSTTRAEPHGRQSGDQMTRGPILVATDGTAAAEPALTAARILAARDGAEVEVLSVLEPVAPLPPLVGGIPLPQQLDTERAATLRESVARQVRDTVGEPGWNVEVVQGHPPATIARMADRAEARMIIMGLGRHDVSDRLFGDETALRVLRLAKVPVLAVAPGFDALPTRVLVAVDFSPSSELAARVAMGVAAPDATVELAHVAPKVEPLMAPWERFGAEVPDHDYSGSLERMRDALGAANGMRIETTLLRGHPAQTLLEHGRATGAHLVVAGTHGYGFLQRMFVGSVATRILRGSTVSVLVVPQSFVSAQQAESDETSASRIQSVQEQEWARRLEQFTQRNAARRCMVEIDDPSFGAQLQCVDYPLLGVAYDRRDRRVEIMLGERESGNHITKSIGDVSAIDVVEGGGGRDRVLRISHGQGQTLLTIA